MAEQRKNNLVESQLTSATMPSSKPSFKCVEWEVCMRSEGYTRQVYLVMESQDTAPQAKSKAPCHRDGKVFLYPKTRELYATELAW